MSREEPIYFGGIEAGGTKFVCVIASGPEDIVAETTFLTTDPRSTIEKVISFLIEGNQRYPLQAIGVASFGPVDLVENSVYYGYITSTPKPGWAYTNIVGEIKKAIHLPVGFDTDVNGAVLGEYMWGAGKGKNSIIYITVGTGIGGGAISSGNIIHGLLHPEMGHIRIPHNLIEDPFPGNCPYHGDCLEGLASGLALEDRWKMPASLLSSDHPGWDLEAWYLALALVNYSFTLSPENIIIGGGVINHPGLIEAVRNNFLKLMNNYIQKDEITREINSYIVKPGLANRSGVLGAVALAMQSIK